MKENQKNERIGLFFVIFFVILGCFFLIRSELHADPFRPFALTEIMHFDNKCLTGQERQYYHDKAEFHKKEGERCFQDAKDMCWYLPHIDDRTMARNCFTTAFSMVGSMTPQTRIVVLVGKLMMDYGLEALNEWDAINTKLYWAQYHFEMYDFYSDLVAHA
jgi:hypothetical protein